MSNQMLTPPSTLSGIKSLAKRIKAEQVIPHHKALNVAAQRAGYQNFNHARNTIEHGPIPRKMIYITSYWVGDENSEDNGRITLAVPLSRTIGEFLKPNQVRYSNRYTGGFKLEFTDHIEAVHDSGTEVGYKLKAAVRTIQFMERTGLRKAGRNFPKSIEKLLGHGNMKGSDHMSWWSVPKCPDKWVVLDEPYNRYDRESWAAENGINAVKAWGLGLYLGGDTYTTVFTASEAYSNEILQDMKEIALNDRNIVTEHAPYDSVFVSPARAAAHKVRKARPMPLEPGTVQGKRISFGGLAGENSRWRPSSSLAINEHLKIGPLLWGLRASGVPYWADYHLLDVANTLCNWFFQEHRDKITEKIEFAYNGEGKGSQAFKIQKTLTNATAKIGAIESVKTILSEGYPACRPLQELIKWLNLVAAHICKASEKSI